MRLGARTRERRLALRLTQAQLGARIGIHQTAVSALERGRAASFSLTTWATTAAALGYELAAFFEGAPTGDAPMDVEHLRRQQLVVSTAAGGAWRARLEHPVTVMGGGRAVVDVLLERPAGSELCVVEVWNWLANVGHAWRNHADKVAAIQAAHSGQRVSGLFVLRGTRRNRALVSELSDLFEVRFAASSARMLAALRDPAIPAPDGDTLLWTDAAASRLLPARPRLGPRRPAR